MSGDDGDSWEFVSSKVSYHILGTHELTLSLYLNPLTVCSSSLSSIVSTKG